MAQRPSGIRWRRAAAFVVDGLGYAVVWFAAVFWYTRHNRSSVYYVYDQAKSLYVQDLLVLIVLFFVQHFLYHLCFRASLGQNIVGLTYVQANGERVAVREIAARSAVATLLFPVIVLAPELLVRYVFEIDDILDPFIVQSVGVIAAGWLSLATDAEGRTVTERVVGWRLVRRQARHDQPASRAGDL